MGHMNEYRETDESKYVGKEIAQQTFLTDRGEMLLIKIFDNRTYTIDHYVRGRRDYKRIDKASLAANDLEFKRIDPEFKEFLTIHLNKYYQL